MKEMKVLSTKINDTVYFTNFIVVKESENFYGVYEKGWDNKKFGNVITSGTSLNNACKKAKLLQIGHNIAKENFTNYY